MQLIYLKDTFNNLVSIISTMGVVDYIEILLFSYLVYKILKFVKETRAEQLLRGIIAVVVVLLIIRQLTLYNRSFFNAFGFLSETFFSVGMMAIIVTFQPELRRALERMGRTKVVQTFTFSTAESGADISAAIDQIAGACEKLSRSATGALIVMERKTKLGEQVNTGTMLNANPSAELFGNIFFPNSPLHDGAVIVRDGIILAAGCYLPKPNNEELISKDLGTRHRAAIGMSEISDAVIIVVSEETGIISIAENGSLKRGLDRAALTKHLNDSIIIKDSENDAPKQKRIKKRNKRTEEMV
ncbi:MAG: diadenylate cyclase CdaA [Oscillospiraceae bacterium]|nr:diadenylate cyclase CdaA [Oscillospiraceae bacterium]